MLRRQVRFVWLVELWFLVLLTILFNEWLLPLLELTDTHSLSVFLFFFMFVLLVSMFSWPWYVNVPIHLLAIMHILHYLYFSGPVFSMSWLYDLGEQLSYSSLLLLRWDLTQLPFEVRTLFFLLSIWYVAAYLHISRLRRRSMFTFLVMTTIYLATLDTFTPYQAGYAIARVVLVGFLYLAVLEYLRIKRLALIRMDNKLVSKVKPSFFSPFFWVGSSLFILGMAMLVGVISPKAEPQWPDPVAFLQSTGLPIGSGLGSPVQKVGYGENDTVLGGGFVQDDSVAFYAITTKQHYWRGESKDIYTGKGWEKSTPAELFFIPPQREPINLKGHPGKLFVEGLEMESAQTKVYFTEHRFSTIFYQGDIKQAKVFPSDVYVQLDPRSGRFTTWEDEVFTARKEIAEYVLESEYPLIKVSDLLAANQKEIPEHILRRYTQLPETLPNRIKELAVEITAGLDNQYEQVKEIENYFRRNGFRYETKNVPVPRSDQDYVDQFLFETKQGYCDNFSTAMVVMLRTIDIPARWVKGFTFGEIIEQNDGYYYIQVLNRHAHSWVEVYFPGIGWVPFEPTQTFTNPYSFYDDQAGSLPTAQLDELIGQEQERDEQQKEESEFEEAGQESQQETSTNTESPVNAQFSGPVGWKLILWVLIGLLMPFSVLYFGRYRLLSWLIANYKRKKEQEENLEGYELLINYLGMLAMKRKPSQTLREYVLQLEEHMSTDWVGFTREFERLRYGRKSNARKKDS